MYESFDERQPTWVFLEGVTSSGVAMLSMSLLLLLRKKIIVVSTDAP